MLLESQIVIFVLNFITSDRLNNEKSDRTPVLIASLRDLYQQGVTFYSTDISSRWDCPVRDNILVESNIHF